MCPSFLPLPSSPEGGEMSGKYLQLFISHNLGCQYYIGVYDTQRDLFIPETHGRMTWVDNTFFAPEALIDSQGRQIMWAWLSGSKHKEIDEAIEDGWCGVYGLPRVLWLGGDNTLRIAPAKELETLRYNPKSFDTINLTDDSTFDLKGINGRSCEIAFSIDLQSAQQTGIKVRSSLKNEETTLLYYDATQKKLVFDSTASGPLGRTVVEKAPFNHLENERLSLRVFIDNSVVEIFANDRQVITRRVYPERDDSDHVSLFCKGGTAAFTDIETWEMMPSNGS